MQTMRTDTTARSRRTNVAKQQNKKIFKASLWWPILYMSGLILGLVAITSLVYENWDVRAVPIITYSFLGIGGGIGVLGVVLIFLSCSGLCRKRNHKIQAFVGATGYLIIWGLGFVGGAAALYSDWILAAIAGNYAGAPSGDIDVIFWLYFVAKRLPLVSF
jgi:hypothetical protein